MEVEGRMMIDDCKDARSQRYFPNFQNEKTGKPGLA